MSAVANKFKTRRSRFEEIAIRPLTPTTADMKALDEEVEEKQKKNVLVIDDFSEPDPYEGMGRAEKFVKKYLMLPHCKLYLPIGHDLNKDYISVIHPQSTHMTFFLGLQTFSVLYNLWVIPLRFSFTIYQNEHSLATWAALDYFCDALYIFDTVLVKPRVMFLDRYGIYEIKREDCMRHYVKNGTFKKDLASLVPLDVLYLAFGFTGRATILRSDSIGEAKSSFLVKSDRFQASSPPPPLQREHLLRQIGRVHAVPFGGQVLHN